MAYIWIQSINRRKRTNCQRRCAPITVANVSIKTKRINCNHEKEFENNNNFNVKVLVTATTGHLNNQYLKANYKNELIKNYEFFKEKNFCVDLAYDIENEEYINLNAFNPDIIFYGEPWDLAKIQSIPITSRFALACFCCYGTTIHNGTYEYTKPFYRELFKYFIDNYYAQDLMIEHDVDPDSLEVFGSIKLDAYLSPIDYSKILWKSEGKKRVIYAPHHSFDKKTILKYGTFDKNYKFFLEYAKTHQDVEFIIKPHPTLKKEIIRHKLMNETQMKKYFEEWINLQNAQICEDGDYFDMFRTSDLMITDCNSFLSEYLPTEKPVIHLISKHSVGHNKYGEQIIAGYYKSYSNEETEKLLDNILYKNQDPLLEKRKKIINTDFVWNREGTAKGIVKYLENIIFNNREME